MKGLRTDNSKICGKDDMRRIGDTANLLLTLDNQSKFQNNS